MTPAEHYKRAEELLDEIEGMWTDPRVGPSSILAKVTVAQTHAFLAQADIKRPTQWGTVVVDT